jgi:hypothetical protein
MKSPPRSVGVELNSVENQEWDYFGHRFLLWEGSSGGRRVRDVLNELKRIIIELFGSVVE